MSAVRKLSYQEVAAHVSSLPMPVSGFDESDAARNVADTLVAGDVLIELVQTVADSKELMSWLAESVTVPFRFLAHFRQLDEQVTRIARLHSDECAALGVGEES